MKVVLLMIALVLTLTGCDTAEAETLVPGVTPDSPDINFGQIPGGLPAGFYDEAEENVSVAVERYIAISDEITAAGASDISSMEALVSPEWWETERAGFSTLSRTLCARWEPVRCPGFSCKVLASPPKTRLR